MRDIVRQTNRVVLNTSERIASRWFCDAAPQADVQYAAQIRARRMVESHGNDTLL